MLTQLLILAFLCNTAVAQMCLGAVQQQGHLDDDASRKAVVAELSALYLMSVYIGKPADTSHLEEISEYDSISAVMLDIPSIRLSSTCPEQNYLNLFPSARHAVEGFIAVTPFDPFARSSILKKAAAELQKAAQIRMSKNDAFNRAAKERLSSFMARLNGILANDRRVAEPQTSGQCPADSGYPEEDEEHDELRRRKLQETPVLTANKLMKRNALFRRNATPVRKLFEARALASIFSFTMGFFRDHFTAQFQQAANGDIQAIVSVVFSQNRLQADRVLDQNVHRCANSMNLFWGTMVNFTWDFAFMFPDNASNQIRTLRNVITYLQTARVDRVAAQNAFPRNTPSWTSHQAYLDILTEAISSLSDLWLMLNNGQRIPFRGRA